MPLTPDAIFVAGPGGVFLGEVGIAEAPTNATDAPEDDLTGWVQAGVTAKDPGIAIATAKTSKDIESFEFFDPVRTIMQSRIRTVTIAFLEVNQETLNLALDGIEVIGSSPDYEIHLNDPSHQVETALIVDGKDGDRVIRNYFPRVKVDTTGDMPFRRTDETQLVVTLKVLAPSDGSDAWQPFVHDPDNVGNWTPVSS
jgi:hypothetical protein